MRPDTIFIFSYSWWACEEIELIHEGAADTSLETISQDVLSALDSWLQAAELDAIGRLPKDSRGFGS